MKTGRRGGRFATLRTDHVAAVACAQRDGVPRVDVRKVALDVLEAVDEVVVGAAAPVARDGVRQRLPVSRAARRVRHHHHVALLREHRGVPPRRPVKFRRDEVSGGRQFKPRKGVG